MKVSKSPLKDELLKYLDWVESQNEEIIITNNDLPVLKISKYEISPTTDDLFKDIRGKIRYFEDLTTPTLEEW